MQSPKIQMKFLKNKLKDLNKFSLIRLSSNTNNIKYVTKSFFLKSRRIFVSPIKISPTQERSILFFH